MTHTARIVAVGDELLLGRTVDTNSSWLARWCTDRGFAVTECQIVGDDETQLVGALRRASANVDLVLVTGGLGPTEDDRTRQALATLLDVPLRENAQAWEQVAGHWQKLGREGEPPQSNRRQALVPRGAKVLRNDRGTAPGLLAQSDNCWIACLPGVPHEMKAMAERLSRRLPKLVDGLKIPAVAELHLAGLGESSLQDLLGELLVGDKPRIGVTAHELGHITVRAVGSVSAVERRIGEIRKLVEEWVLPADGLAASLVAHLAEHGQQITAAESCTCGHVVAMLGAVAGASKVLRRSVVAYHNQSKRQDLAVDGEVLKAEGAVSEAVVRQMAEGVRERSGADLAVATSGIAGPGGGSRGKPVGTVWLAAATAERTIAKRIHVHGTRERIQRRAAAGALLLGWRLLVVGEG